MASPVAKTGTEHTSAGKNEWRLIFLISLRVQRMAMTATIEAMYLKPLLLPEKTTYPTAEPKKDGRAAKNGSDAQSEMPKGA